MKSFKILEKEGIKRAKKPAGIYNYVMVSFHGNNVTVSLYLRTIQLISTSMFGLRIFLTYYLPSLYPYHIVLVVLRRISFYPGIHIIIAHKQGMKKQVTVKIKPSKLEVLQTTRKMSA